MFTSIDKAIAAAVLGVASIINLVWGHDIFGWGEHTEQTVGTIIAVLLPIVVWMIPNRRAIMPVHYDPERRT